MNLFKKKHNKSMQWLWWIIAIIVIIGMVFLYSPIFSGSTAAPDHGAPVEVAEVELNPEITPTE